MIVPGFTIESTLTMTHAPTIELDDDALARKQLLASTSFSALSTAAPNPSALESENKFAAFRGLFVVESATEARHVKYAMEIASPALQLHVRVTQRYSAFFVLRKRLLQSLTKCQDAAARPNLLNDRRFLDFEFSPWRPCCAGCKSARKVLLQTPFPRRAFVFTTVDDVDARAPLLETFLSACVQLLGEWPGCVRGRKFVCVVLGQFLGINLLFHVFHQLRLTLAETASREDTVSVDNAKDETEKETEKDVIASPPEAPVQPSIHINAV